MIPDQFLYCRLCHEVHHGAPFDSAPIYDPQGMTVREFSSMIGVNLSIGVLTINRFFKKLTLRGPIKVYFHHPT